MATFTGTSGNDNGIDAPAVTGGPEDDLLQGLAGNDVLNGAAGNDTLEGGAGDDSLLGGAGDDMLYGATGVDTLRGEAGDDTLMWAETDFEAGLWDGGAGTDTAFMQRWQPAGIESISNIVFENMEIFDAWDLNMIIAPGQLDGFDQIVSSNDAPSSSPLSGIFNHATNGESDWSGKIASGFSGRFEAPRNAPGVKGDDVFRIAGADTGWQITDWDGDDLIEGGEGNDTITAGADNDTIIANGGDDLIRLVSGDDSVLAGAGDDLLVFDTDSRDDADTLDGGDGFDELAARLSSPDLRGKTFIDIERLSVSSVRYDAGQLDAFDELTNVSVLNQMSGGVTDLTGTPISAANANQITVNLANLDDDPDTFLAPDATVDIQINGSRGADTVVTGLGNDTIFGAGGDQRLESGGGDDLIDAREGDDHLDGGAGNDTLEGDEGRDTILGGEGDDSITGGRGNDRMEGGEGDDFYSVIDNGDRVIEAAGGGTDTILTRANLNLRGSEVEVVQVDGFGEIRVIGNQVATEITGGGGVNVLVGGGGGDTVTGGGGADVFAFTIRDADGPATVTDFSEGDQLALDDRFFGLGDGRVDVREVTAAQAANAIASGTFVYDRSSGEVFIDGDGSRGSDAPELIAIIDGGVRLGADDVLLF